MNTRTDGAELQRNAGPRWASLGFAAVLACFVSTSSPGVGPAPPGAGDAALEDTHVVTFSTYIGGAREDFATAVAVDPSGAAYVVGYTRKVDFPYDHAFGCDGTCGNGAFVVKVSPSGQVVYSTFLDGVYPTAVAVTEAGAAVVVGHIQFRDFPVVHAIQPERRGASDAFIAMLSPEGDRLRFATYLGGDDTNPWGIEGANQVALGPDGGIYVAGQTGFLGSVPFPTTPGAFDVTPDASRVNGWVARLAPDGSALEWSTLLDGCNVRGLAVDSAGAVFVSGWTAGASFPIVEPLQETVNGEWDAFLMKISPDGSALLFSTPFGGSLRDLATEVRLDANGDAVFSGATTSTDLPVVTPFQGANAGGAEGDAFLARISSDGRSLLYSTYLGGQGNDNGGLLAVGPGGGVYVVGSTQSTDFPLVNSAADHHGGVDEFLAAFDPTGAVDLCTCLGGSKDDVPYGVAADAAGGIWIVGKTDSKDFPLVNPFDWRMRKSDAFLLRVAPGTIQAPVITSLTPVESPDEPLRLRIGGSNFQPSIAVYIGDDAAPWAHTQWKRPTTILLRGRTLEGRLPVGTPVTIRLRNPDGGEAVTTFTR
jgi:hypothetical protein